MVIVEDLAEAVVEELIGILEQQEVAQVVVVAAVKAHRATQVALLVLLTPEVVVVAVGLPILTPLGVPEAVDLLD